MSTRCTEPQRIVRDDLYDPEAVLLVRGSSHDGAIIRLHGKVLTIGSSPNVKVRLVAKGVRPLHAVLIRGRARTVYRAYDGEVTVNGIPTCEGVIHPGDLLGIGPVRLVFMTPDSAELPGQYAKTSHLVHHGEKGGCATSELTFSVNRPGEVETPPRRSLVGDPMGDDASESAFLDAAASPTLESSVWNENNSDCDEPSHPQVPAIMAGLVATMTQFRTEIDEIKSAISNLHAKLADLEEKTEKRFDDLVRIVPRLENMLEETRQQQSVAEEMLLQVRAGLERLDRMETEIVRRQIDLATEQTKLDTKTAILASREAVLEQPDGVSSHLGSALPGRDHGDRHDVTAHVTRSSMEGAEQTDNLAAGNSGLLAFRTGEVGNHPTVEGGPKPDSALNQGRNEEARSAGPVQMPETPRLEKSGGGTQVVHNNASGLEAPQVHPQSNGFQQAPGNSEDNSSDSNQEHQRLIQEYLARLLRRAAAGESAEGLVSEGIDNVASSDQSTTTTPPVEEEKGKNCRRRAGVSRQQGFARKRTRAPEKGRNFAAMRELANLSSQAAIDRYAKAKLRQVRQEKTIVLLVAILCGVALLALHLWVGTGPLGWIALSLVFVVIVVYGMQYGLLSGRLIINSKGQLQLAERRIGREMRKLMPIARPSLLEADQLNPGESGKSDLPNGHGP